MAGSRLEKIGSLFSRATGLLRTGAIKYEDRPIWYDVYRVFPPKLEPHFDRQPVLPEGIPEEVPNILYHEDIPRAAFYKAFGNNPGGTTRQLTNLEQDDLSQRFIEKFNEAKDQHKDWTTDQIVESISHDFSFQRPQPSQSQPSFSRSTSNTNTNTSNRSTSVSSGYSINSLVDAEDTEPDDDLASKRGRKINIIRADTLLSMFKEAKEKGESETNKNSADGDKDKDK